MTNETHDPSDYKLDRTGWPAGPWDDEPEDRVEWRSEGVPRLPCLIVRGPAGAWCGYVGVPPGHPWHGKDDSQCRTADDDYVDVHGGITYAAACNGHAICHVPKPGESPDVWWLGFDCNHLGDEAPKSLALDIEHGYGRDWRGGSYKTASYAKAQTEKLAQQAREVCK